MRVFLAFICLCSLAACTNFPQIDAANRDLGPVGAPPPLLPFAELEAAIAGAPQTDPQGEESLQARAAALRARAAILNTPLSAPDDIDRVRARLR